MFVERGRLALGDIHRSKNTSQNAKIHSSQALFLPALQFLSPGTNCAQIQEKSVFSGSTFKYIAAIASTRTRCYRKRCGLCCTRHFPLNHRHHQSLHPQFLPRWTRRLQIDSWHSIRARSIVLQLVVGTPYARVVAIIGRTLAHQARAWWRKKTKTRSKI